jgi:hypothetical protein
MKLTQFVLYKNTYFTDMQNTVHFESNQKRDEFFDTEFANNGNTYRFDSNFNFRRDRGTIKVPDTFENLMGFNYCRFVNGFDGKTYYAYIVSMSYLNDATTQLDIVIDVVMTYTQGNVLETLQNVEVIRQHLPKWELDQRMDWLRNNDDTLATSSMMFTDPTMLGGGINFGSCSYVILSAVKLDSDFGNEDNPKMKTATGERFDGITTPMNMYVCDGNLIKDLMNCLSDYPWIAQNIKSVTKVPSLFVPKDLPAITVGGKVSLHVLGHDKHSTQIDTPFNIKLNDLRKYLGLNDRQTYLVRDNVINVYLTDYRGNQLNFETSKIGDDNHIKVTTVIGAFNETHIYSEQYGQRDTSKKTKQGYYRDNEMVISQYDNMPMLIDNYKLNKANTAYTRQLENSRQLSGRINTLTDNDASLKDRLFSAVSVYSNVFSGGLMSAPAKATGLFANEYEYYRDQKAQYKQWKIAPPTVTEGSYNNSILQNTNDYGIWLKVSRIDDDELNMLKTYYGKFGFEAMKGDNHVRPLDTWTVCNWLQIKGPYIIPDIDRELLDQLKTILEGGVRFFHDYYRLKTTTDFSLNMNMK